VRHYAIRLSRSAKRDLNQLPEKIRERALDFIYNVLSDNPQRVGAPLRAPQEGQHEAVTGSYRIIYRIVDAEVLVEVVGVAHRADVYRP